MWQEREEDTFFIQKIPVLISMFDLHETYVVIF